MLFAIRSPHVKHKEGIVTKRFTEGSTLYLLFGTFGLSILGHWHSFGESPIVDIVTTQPFAARLVFGSPATRQ
jgi:hypothetical protein